VITPFGHQKMRPVTANIASNALGTAMFVTGLSYFLKHPLRSVAALAADPLETWAALRDAHLERREGSPPPDLYKVEDDWEHRLHDLLKVPWPCGVIAEFQVLWHGVIAELQGKGVCVGPESYQSWNDGDTGLVRAIWCLTRHLKPRQVIETGVAHGLTSRFILEALERNGAGHLWSIDRQPLERALHSQIGVAVGDRFPHRWSYVTGSSRRRLPGLLSQLGEIDLFIHDSSHTEANVRFELDHAWRALQSGGAIVVDDIDLNRGFRSFTLTFSGHQSLVCEAEPIRPDFRRFNKKGLFGIILKHPAQSCAKSSLV
jgi:hypothetical protein